MRPLYHPFSRGDVPRDGGIAASKFNTGLWYDKFCNKWSKKTDTDGREYWTLEKLDWIETVMGPAVGDSAALTEARDRMKGLLNAFKQAPLPFETEGPFVTGLGRSHPVENGFAWHHTLSVPYLPGSSVKGMVRAWVKHWYAGGNAPHQSDDIVRIFGTKHGLGSVVFLDAIPEVPVKLKADIMTPHYVPYYSEGKPPADWYSPIPIPFLVVVPGTKFLFGILPLRPDRDQHPSDCETATAWLKDALREIGAGAKTAVGYGRFVPPADEASSNNDARASSEAATETSHGKAAPSTAVPAKDEITLFREWFDREGFAQGKKRGEQNKVMERIAKLPDPKTGIDYVRSRLKKKDPAPSVWAWLQQQHSNGDK